MKLEPIRIPGEADTLAGLHYVPVRAAKSTALVLTHGFTSGKHSMDSLAAYLCGKGYPAITLDLIGHKIGATGGEMHRTQQAAENVRDALRWVRTHLEVQQVVLIGHSMGGAASLQVAAWERQAPTPTGARLAGLVCLCIGLEPTRGFTSPVGQTLLRQRQDYVAGAPALELLEGLNELLASAPEVGPTPALFVAARQDVLVTPAQVAALASLVGPSAEVREIDSSHLEAPDRARGTVAQWLEER